MDEFDLDRLTDHDFELVCKDVFELILGQRLEVFAPGADGGMDLRYLAPGGTDPVIVQCKHWSRSGRAQLLRHYRATEAKKVASLAPRRYMVATSASLTPAAKSALLKLLSPHLCTTGDVLGSEELVAELRKHPEIVKGHLRLWLTSSAVLQTLLSKHIHQRADFFKQDIAETLKTYAPTPAYNDASEILNNHHVLVVAGIPGIGKTTLAQVVAAAHQAEGYEIYEIANDIDDALDVWDDEVPQLFYYDDFLGQTSLRDTVATSEDSRLIQLIRRISQSANKRLVLTTREYILAQARQESETITRSRSLALGRYILDISRYSLAARAEILYNHLHFSQLPGSHKAAFAEPSIYLEIINHKNFNPRLIAITFENALQAEATPEQSVERLMANLEEPSALWAHMFDNQMSPSEVGLVITLFTFRGSVDVDTLVETWAKSNSLNLRDSARTAKRSLAALEGTFIRITEPGRVSRSPIVELHNPSIRDFLRTRLSSDALLIRVVLQEVQKFEQLASLLSVAAGHEGQQLMSHLVHERELVERKFKKTMPAELEGLNESRWFGALWKGIRLGLALDSETILQHCEDALDGEWPEYASDPAEVVALIRALRESPDGSALREREKAVTEWLIEDLMHDTSNWDALQSAEAHLRELGGPTTNAALDTIDEYKFELAKEATEAFENYGLEPKLSEALEILEHLEQYGDIAETVHGLSSFRSSVEYATERLRERPRSRGTTPNSSAENSIADIATMMDHLRGQA